MAIEGFDKLIGLTDSRYRLSMIVGQRAAQIKNGIPTTLTHEESPKTRNTVTVALREMVLDKGLVWGDDLPTVAELKQSHEQEKRIQAAQAAYSVSTDRPE